MAIQRGKMRRLSYFGNILVGLWVSLRPLMEEISLLRSDDFRL